MKNHFFKSIVFFTSSIFIFNSSTVLGQAVSINATGTAPHTQSILDITSTTKGVLLSRMTTAQRTAFTPTTTGMTVYDTTTESYWYWNDTTNQWMEIPNTAGIVTTLDGAYDGGGSGAGRTITADAGAVQITGTGGTIALTTDGDIQVTEDDAWIGSSPSLQRLRFDDNSGGRIHVEDADLTVDDGKWVGIDGSNPRIEFDDTNNELNLLNADIGIGTTAPDNQSLADFRSTTKGILFPRMTTAERNAIGQGTNTDYGLWIYNEDTDNYNYWDGNSWEEVPVTSELDADDDWYQTNSTNTPTAIGDWIYTNGNVGINTGSTIATNPLAALHVQSNAYVGDYNTGGYFNTNATIHVAKTDNPHVMLEDIGHNTGGLSLDNGGLNVSTENGDIDFRTGVTGTGSFSGTGSSRMFIESGGEVGIGTVTPDAHLNVGNASGGNILITKEGTSPTVGQTLGSLLFDAEGTSVSTTDASAVIRGLAAENQGNSNKGGHLTFLTKATGSGIGTAATERMRIQADGNVGIGVTNPSVKFQVAGDATISGKFNSNGIQESSDKRFKKDIEPLDGALENILKLEGVTYSWRKDEFPNRNFGTDKEIGVIAQELEKVYPELVATDTEGYKSVQYSHLVPVLIEAIKDQQELIQSLESNVDNLKADLSSVLENNKMLTNQFETLISKIESINLDVEALKLDAHPTEAKLD